MPLPPLEAYSEKTLYHKYAQMMTPRIDVADLKMARMRRITIMAWMIKYGNINDELPCKVKRLVTESHHQAMSTLTL